MAGGERLGRVLERADPATVLFAARIHVYALGLSALWTTLNVVVLPERITSVSADGIRGTSLGLITLVGIGMAAVLQPLAGQLSDRAPMKDRRRPFIVAPAFLVVALIGLLWWAPTLAWVIFAYILIQIAGNVSQAAFQGLLPDLIPENHRGVASGVKTALGAIGTVLGLGGAAAAVALGFGYGGSLVTLGALLAGAAVATIYFVPRVPPLPIGERAEGLADLLSPRVIPRTFTAIGRATSEFRLAVLILFLFLLGMNAVQRFFLYFLEDRFEMTNPAGTTALFLAGGIILGASGAAIGGLLSDPLGRAAVLRASIVLCAAGVAVMAAAPTLSFVAIGGALAIAGGGSFQAVNWALLSDTMPAERGGHFFGLANVAAAGAAALVGLLGPVVDVANVLLPDAAYRVTFGLAALVAISSLVPLQRLSRAAKASL